MAPHAGNAAVHVHRVIEIDVVGGLMDLHPLDRLAAFPGIAHRLELRIILLHLRVAVHADLRGGHIGMGGHFHEGMAIPAIHPELGDVHIVREGDRLHRLIPHAGVFGSEVVPDPGGDKHADEGGHDSEFERNPVGAARENIRHALEEWPARPVVKGVVKRCYGCRAGLQGKRRLKPWPKLNASKVCEIFHKHGVLKPAGVEIRGLEGVRMIELRGRGWQAEKVIASFVQFPFSVSREIHTS
jgi:hypothetical protein